MKNPFTHLIFIICISCNPQKKIENEKKDTNHEHGIIWTVQNDTIRNCIELKKIRQVSPEAISPEVVTFANNEHWKKVPVQVRKISNDTIYLKVDGGKVLTQEMGSAGAASYMATTTYNYTEIIGINYVNFIFEEGDHARPGTYQREDFECF
ncbi:MAG: hypothetical protein M3512_01150 [Bacteroidota bacterium]|nr:hypothetical protein [Bacteroidota bacterium]